MTDHPEALAHRVDAIIRHAAEEGDRLIAVGDLAEAKRVLMEAQRDLRDVKREITDAERQIKRIGNRGQAEGHRNWPGRESARRLRGSSATKSCPRRWEAGLMRSKTLPDRPAAR